MSAAFPAATVMAFRCDQGPPEVFLVRRHIRMGFFGGAYVFPGGRVDEADRDPAAAAWCTGAEIAGRSLEGLDPIEATSYYIAAVREVFEESGILIARDAAGRWAEDGEGDRAWIDRARRAVHDGEASLRETLEPRGLKPPLDALIPIGHWVTPEVEAKRFDTRFFVVRVDAAAAALHDDAEHVDSAWMTPREALARFDRRDIVLAPPTWRTLRDFSTCATWDEIEAQARRSEIQRIQPRFVRQDGDDLLVIPGDPLYPVAPAAALTEPTRFRRESDRWQPLFTSA